MLLKTELTQAWRSINGNEATQGHRHVPSFHPGPTGNYGTRGQSLALGTSSLRHPSNANTAQYQLQPAILRDMSTLRALQTTPRNIVQPKTVPQYFELCLNARNHKVKHVELDISNITSDGGLFERIWDIYNAHRGYGISWFFLRPNNVHFVVVCSTGSRLMEHIWLTV
jgi:hypothetical protein